MEKKIKFRGKSQNENKWIYGFYYNDSAWDYILPSGLMPNEDTWDFCVQSESVGQYTGIKDKFGKEIYEGDVVMLMSNDKRRRDDSNFKIIGYVKKNTLNPSMCIEYRDDFGRLSWDYDFVKKGQATIEILGNVFDNGEMISWVKK